MVAQLIHSIEQEQLKDVPQFGAGDTIRVHAKVVEGNRERVQVFEGVVIRRRGGGINENFTVRRIAAHSVGVERTFLIHSPRIDRIEVVRHGKVRRAKLYYLRGLTGRAARITERRRDLTAAARKASDRAEAEAEALAAEQAAAAASAAEAAATEAQTAENDVVDTTTEAVDVAQTEQPAEAMEEAPRNADEEK